MWRSTLRSSFSPTRFRNAREGAGHSREALGRLIDRSYFTIEAWERGKSVPSIRTACMVADTLGVPVDAFFEQLEVAV